MKDAMDISKKSSMRLLLTVGFLVFSGMAGVAGDIKIIANPSLRVDAISQEELRAVFLLQRRTLKDGSRVVPVLKKGGPTYDAFAAEYLGRDPEEMRIFYQGLIFTGKGAMPKEFGSDAEIVAYVSAMPGALAYVSGETVLEGVKVLTVRRARQSGERTLITRVEPQYPETLKQMGIGGSVRLRLSISPEGAVDRVLVLGGNPILAEAAVKAVKQWVYAAGPTQTTAEVTITFQPNP